MANILNFNLRPHENKVKNISNYYAIIFRQLQLRTIAMFSVRFTRLGIQSSESRISTVPMESPFFWIQALQIFARSLPRHPHLQSHGRISLVMRMPLQSGSFSLI